MEEIKSDDCVSRELFSGRERGPRLKAPFGSDRDRISRRSCIFEIIYSYGLGDAG